MPRGSLLLSRLMKAILLVTFLVSTRAWSCEIPEPEYKSAGAVLWIINGSGRGAYDGRDPRYQKYVSWVRSHTLLNARGLMAEHMKVGEQVLKTLGAEDKGRRRIKRDQEAVRRALRGAGGSIHRISCMEAIPFLEYLRRNPGHSWKEFGADIMTKGGKTAIIGYYNSRGGYVIETPGSVGTRLFLRKQGWKDAAHLHLHPFNFKSKWGDPGGTVVPSAGDTVHYRNRGLSTAIITNGIESMRFPTRAY